MLKTARNLLLIFLVATLVSPQWVEGQVGVLRAARVLLADGTSSAPAYSWANDADLGAWRIGADEQGHAGSLAIRGPRPWVDVRAYGAKGDGITDDKAAIQAAHDALPSNGGIIFFPTPSAHYAVGGKITISKSGVHLMGSAPLHSYASTVKPTLIKALSSFTPVTDSMISISDGVSEVKITNLEIDLNQVVTGSALHVVTGVAGLGHDGIDLDGVLIRGNTGATAYAIQIDSLGFSSWGTVVLSNFKNGLRWQALNQAAGATLGNSNIDYLYLKPLAPGIAGTNVYLQNFGITSIGLLQSLGDDYTTTRTALALDVVQHLSIQVVDIETVKTGLTTTGSAGNHCALNNFLGGTIRATNAVLLQANTFQTSFYGINFDGAGQAGGTGISDQSNALGTPWANNFNWIYGGVVTSFTTPVTVLNGPKLQIRGLASYSPQNPAAITVGASPFTYTNTNPWPEGVTIKGGNVTSVTGRAGVNFTGVNGSFGLYPGDSLVVTYTDAPGMSSFPEMANGAITFLPVALGGGAAPTLGTIGGSGPATAAQDSWARMEDSAGNVFWVPAWR